MRKRQLRLICTGGLSAHAAVQEANKLLEKLDGGEPELKALQVWEHHDSGTLFPGSHATLVAAIEANADSLRDLLSAPPAAEPAESE